MHLRDHVRYDSGSRENGVHQIALENYHARTRLRAARNAFWNLLNLNLLIIHEGAFLLHQSEFYSSLALSASFAL